MAMPLDTPAISNDNHGFRSNDQVRISHDTVPGRLTGTVAVIKQMLAVRIVYRSHRELEQLLHFPWLSDG